jgi:hypothetical protein
MRCALVLIATALVLAGCGGDDETAAPSSAPKGFTVLDGKSYTFAYPSGWTRIAATNTLGAQGPKDAKGLAPQVAVAAGPGPGVSLDLAVEGFKGDNKIRRAGWKVTHEQDFKLPGASEARLIEARFDAVTGDTTTPVRSIDVLARDADGNQYDMIVRAPEADFDRLRLREVVDTFRIK